MRKAGFCKGWIIAALAAWLAVLALPAGAAPALVLDENFRHADLSDHLDVLDIDGDQVPVPHDLASQFHPLTPGDLSPSHRAGWLRFGVINPRASAQTLILQMKPPPDEKGVAVLSNNDAAVLLPMAHVDRDPLIARFELRVPAHSSAMFYLRTSGNPLATSSLQLHALDHFLTLSEIQSWISGSMLGLLAMLMVIGVLGHMLVHDRLYLWLAGMAGLHLVQLTMLATGLVPTPAEAGITFTYITTAIWILGTACAVQITLRFPAWPPGSRHWPRLLWAAFWIDLGTVVALVAIPQWTTLNVVLLVIMPGALLSTLGPLFACLQGSDRPLRMYAFARAVVLFSGVSFILLRFAQPPLGAYLAELVTLTAVLEIFLMLIALIMRTLTRFEHQALQQRAVAVAEAESRARTESTAAMAHRIRTPVSGVLGMIEMLQDTPLSVAQRESLDTLQRAGSELLNAVNDMSDISRLDFGGDPLQRGSFDLHALVAECVEGFRGLAGNRDLELITDLAPGLPRYVSGDQTRLRQLLLQLMHHALARFQRGEILLQVDGRDRRQQFVLTAHGRAADEPTRGHAEPDPALRLAIARQLIATLDGSIQISPATEHAWRVSFELPLPAIERARVAGETEQNLRHRHLLVIDDSATFREVVQRQAAHWGMHVHSAATLSEGVARLNNQDTIGEPIDLLLLDAELPELTDEDGPGRLREAVLPRAIVLLSTAPEAEHAPLAQALGVRRVLLKPIDQTSLQLALLEELSQPQATRQRAASAGPLHCLIAEDNPINALVLQGLLTKLGATFATAVNGQEAVETFQRQSFDIVFMDCDMPVMDGFEAAQRIREIQQNRGVAPTPIIALTANTLEELGERARTAVMDAHLVKPVRLQSLRELLAHWTGYAALPAVG